MHDFLYPNGITYLVVKLLVLTLAVLLWLIVTSSPAV